MKPADQLAHEQRRRAEVEALLEQTQSFVPLTASWMTTRKMSLSRFLKHGRRLKTSAAKTNG
jgi:hypothetical protein